MVKFGIKKYFKIFKNKLINHQKIWPKKEEPCPDAEEYGMNERFSNKTAIAPTASISIICGGASPGIEPIAANSYTHKTLSGSFNVKNKYLKSFWRNNGKMMMKHGQVLQQTKVLYLI